MVERYPLAPDGGFNTALPEYMTIQDLKEALHIGDEKAYRLVKSRGFPSFRIGSSQWLIDPVGLQEWIRKIQKSPDKGSSL